MCVCVCWKLGVELFVNTPLCVCHSSAGKCLHECERGSTVRGEMTKESQEAAWRKGGGGVKMSRAGRGEWRRKGARI